MDRQTNENPLSEAVGTEPKIEFFFLADRAEAVNGKLYIMGGAWDRLFVKDFNNPIPISFAVGILVPWLATNIRYTLAITIEDPDRNPIPNVMLQATFLAGRPVHLTEGETQRVTLAIPAFPIQVQKPGQYQAVARLSSGDERRVTFHLLPAPSFAMPQPPR